MISERPTLAELRLRVFKPPEGPQQGGDDEVGPRYHPRRGAPGNVLARYWARPAAVHGTWLAIRLGLSAHQVTLMTLVTGLASAIAFGTGARSGFLVGIALLHLTFWLDHVDGQVARWRRTACLDGVFFDYMMHHAHAVALGFGLGYGLAVRTGDIRWSLAGCLAGTGWLFLGLQNDCRYKAFFERLKLQCGLFHVEAGYSGHVVISHGWPREGIRRFTWPAYKSCEPHVVLLTLTVLGIVAVAAPRIWQWALTLYVAVMAIGSLLLAVGRSWRIIAQDSVESEFNRWFQPLGDSDPSKGKSFLSNSLEPSSACRPGSHAPGAGCAD